VQPSKIPGLYCMGVRRLLSRRGQNFPRGAKTYYLPKKCLKTYYFHPKKSKNIQFWPAKGGGGGFDIKGFF